MNASGIPGTGITVMCRPADMEKASKAVTVRSVKKTCDMF
jgi:hypothetical protein